MQFQRSSLAALLAIACSVPSTGWAQQKPADKPQDKPRYSIEERSIKQDRDELQSAAIDTILDVVRGQAIKQQAVRLDAVEESLSKVETKLDDLNTSIQQKLDALHREHQEFVSKVAERNSPDRSTAPSPPPPVQAATPAPVVSAPTIRTVSMSTSGDADVYLASIAFRGQTGNVVSTRRGTKELRFGNRSHPIDFVSTFCPHCTVVGRITGSTGDLLVAYQSCRTRFVIAPAR